MRTNTLSELDHVINVMWEIEDVMTPGTESDNAVRAAIKELQNAWNVVKREYEAKGYDTTIYPVRNSRKPVKSAVSMRDIYTELRDVQFSGKFPKELKTVASYRSAQQAYNDLYKNGAAEVINEEVKDYFENHGFTVKEKGIGWEITNSRKPIKSGYSNNPDYFGDWFGKGQIDFNAIINPEDDGDVWMVKMWSGSGYVLDVYLCKAHDLYEAMDIVFNWSYDNEGANNIVFDYNYLLNECHDEFEKHPDYFGTDLSDDYEEFEMRWFEDYISTENYDLFARDENFFVDKVPDKYLKNSRKPVKSSRRTIKSSVTIEVDDDTFRDMLWERVNDRDYAQRYPDWLWDGIFDDLQEMGWLSPEYNTPSYIVDNIAINGEIVATNEAESNYDTNGLSAEEWANENGYRIISDPDGEESYIIVNYGL